MKRSKICIGFLTLYVPAVLLCLMSSDVSALKHEYDGMSILAPVLPQYSYDSSSHHNYFDWNETSDFISAPLGSGFSLSFYGDSWDNSLNNLRVRKTLHGLHTTYSNNKCVFKDSYNTGFSPIYNNNNYDDYWTSGISQSYPTISTGDRSISIGGDLDYLGTGYYIVPSYYSNFPNDCFSLDGSNNFDLTSYDHLFNNGLPNYPNGGEPLVYNVASVLNNDGVTSRNYYSSGFYYESSHKQSDGVVYNKRFSFNTIFNQNINSFSNLTLGLDNYDGYWYDDQNLYNGRSIDFHFLFSFDSSFELSQSFINGGSLELHASALPKTVINNNDSDFSEYSYNCTSTVRVVGDNQDYYWDISCPVTLERDFIAWIPFLSIDGNGNRVFSTDGNWFFSSVYIVTDHDSTPGDSFNSNLPGINVWDSYWTDNNNQANPGDADWLQTLASLFSFDFFNPFAPIFQMFSDNNSCAQIPVLAGMIHSEETQVCPWFDSTTRNIVTPVLGLSSMMLVFGFAVRWLGSSSGNMFEDSGQHDISSSSTLRSKWRKK